MKKHLFALCFGLLVFPVVGNAGNMFGPAAFRNGSPLVTGVDGTYQAAARAENVTGIFRFAYSGGSQTSSQVQNSWIFFVSGQIQRGGVVADIQNSSINGILDSQGSLSSTGNQTNSNNNINLPLVIINQNNSSAGVFNGKINLKSPNGAFSGQGSLSPLPAQTNNIVGISQRSDGEFSYNGTVPPPEFLPGAIVITTNEFITPAGTIPPVTFNFRGVRTSTATGTTSQVAPN